MNLLEKMATNFQIWAAEQNNSDEIIEEGKLRKIIRKALLANDYIDVEENLDLILQHLKQTKRMATGTINLSGKAQVKIVKLSRVGEFLNH